RLSAWQRARCKQCGALVEAQGEVHPLHRLTGGTLDEVVDGAGDAQFATVIRRRHVEKRDVGADDVRKLWPFVEHAHEWPARKARRHMRASRSQRLGELGMERGVDAANERP